MSTDEIEETETASDSKFVGKERKSPSDSRFVGKERQSQLEAHKRSAAGRISLEASDRRQDILDKKSAARCLCHAADHED